MTTYTRRGPGQSYLKSVLADRINSLIEHKDLNLEINPLKVGRRLCLRGRGVWPVADNFFSPSLFPPQVYEQMIQQIEDDTGSLPPSLPRGVPPEVAAANPDVQAIIVPRLTMLMEIANTFLATIIDSMETVPYGIRWICKQIRSLTRVSAVCVWFGRTACVGAQAAGFEAGAGRLGMRGCKNIRVA
jgi:Ras GTPase-activating-like protein IQGAP2/3